MAVLPGRSSGLHSAYGFRGWVDSWIKNLFPLFFACVGIFILSAPLRLPGQPELMMALVLSTVFFWSVYRPGSMPAVLVFCLGLVVDLMTNGPAGVIILILLIVHGVGISLHYAMKKVGFVTVWFAFSCVAAGASALQWGLTSVFSLALMPVSAAVFELLLAVGIFPILSVVFLKVNKLR